MRIHRINTERLITEAKEKGLPVHHLTVHLLLIDQRLCHHSDVEIIELRNRTRLWKCKQCGKVIDYESY